MSTLKITANQMVELERVFHSESSDNANGLDMDQFVCVFERVLGKMAQSESRRYLTHLFMKIDANCDGTVDWNEFLNFLLNENEHGANNDHDQSSNALYVYNSESLTNQNHTDSISSLIGLPNELISGSLDGTIKIWDRSTLQNKATIINRRNNAWIVDLCHFPMLNQFAAVSMDGIVNFYESNTYKFESTMKIEATPCCANGAADILSIGSESGTAFCYFLNKEDKKPLNLPLHSEWISKIEFIENLQCLVTSSLDSQIKFFDIERRKKQRVYRGHKGGVHSFAYNKEYKYMASCGVQRNIEIFDVNRCKMNAQMIGHQSSVLHVLMNSPRHQIISFSMNKIIKVWDDRTWRCLQTFRCTKNENKQNKEAMCALFADKNNLIFADKSIQKYELTKKRKQKTATAKEIKRGISAAFFNPHFSQIVSSEFEGNINVWDIESGSSTFCYSQSDKITALCFDQSKRRIISGSESGKLKVWNFSSGQCLLQFVDDAKSKFAHWKKTKNKKNGVEISGIVYAMEASFWTKKDVCQWFESLRDKTLRNLSLDVNGEDLLKLTHASLQSVHKMDDAAKRRKLLAAICSLYQSQNSSRYIISVGWDNQIRVWLDSASKRVQLPVSVMQSVQNRIVCVAYYPPTDVITGGCDGSICRYNVICGHFVRKREYPSFLKKEFGEADEDVQCSKIKCLSNGIVVTAHSNGTLVFWDLHKVKQPVLGWRHTSHRQFGGISHMLIAKNSKIILTADPCGYIQIFNILNMHQIESGKQQNLFQNIQCSNIWNSGHNEITCIDYLDDSDLILSSGNDGNIVLWNDKGFKIGVFGQTKGWILSEPKTWIDQESQSQMSIISDIDYSANAMDKNDQDITIEVNSDKNKKGNNEKRSSKNKKNKIEIDGVEINEDTLQILCQDSSQYKSENILSFSSPEIDPYSEEPKIKKKHRAANNIGSKRQLKIFKMDQIPKESPFK